MLWSQAIGRSHITTACTQRTFFKASIISRHNQFRDSRRFLPTPPIHPCTR
ncbi:hypothetical protein X975_03944, partial [Stegodyphus mimosarum]